MNDKGSKPSFGISKMYDNYIIYKSLRKEKQISIIKFLNFVATHLNIEKQNRKSIKKDVFEYLLSKVKYNILIEFESLFKTSYSIKNILKEFGVNLMKKKFTPNQNVIEEIEEYKKFVTDEYNLKLKKTSPPKKQHIRKNNKKRLV